MMPIVEKVKKHLAIATLLVVTLAQPGMTDVLSRAWQASAQMVDSNGIPVAAPAETLNAGPMVDSNGIPVGPATTSFSSSSFSSIGEVQMGDPIAASPVQETPPPPPAPITPTWIPSSSSSLNQVMEFPSVPQNFDPVGCAPPACPVADVLIITKNGPATVAPGGVITYQVIARNNGPSIARQVVVTDPIPSGLTFNPGLSDPTCHVSGPNIVCNCFDMAVGELIVTISFNVQQGLACGTPFYNYAIIQSNTPDPNNGNNTSQTITTTIECPPEFADVSVSKSGPATISPTDSQISYQLRVRNTGPNTARNVIVTDPIPQGLTFNPGMSDPDCHQEGNNVVCSCFDMGVGEILLNLTFNISSQFQCNAVINNYAFVNTSTNDTNPGNNTSQIFSTTVQCPGSDVTISKTGPGTITQGNVLTYTVRTTNHGPGTATNVVARDAIPAGLTFNASASDTACNQGGDTAIYCGAGNLGSGQSRDFSVSFNVPTTTVCNSTIYNTATVISDNDTNQGNNTSQTVPTVIQCPQPQADLSIIKTGPSTIQPGQTLIYELHITNNGPSPIHSFNVIDVITPFMNVSSQHAGGVDLILPIHQGGEGCGVSGLNIDCDGFTLQPGQTAIVRLYFDVPSSTTCNSIIRNYASVNSHDAVDNNPGNNTSQTISTTVECPVQNVDVSVSKTGPGTISRGSILTYTVIVTNHGPGTATNVVARDAIPAGLSFNASASDPACNQGGDNAIYCGAGTLTNGQPKSFSVSFNVPTTTVCDSTILNTATADTTSNDTNSSNDTSQVVSTVIQCPTNVDVSISKTGPSTVLRGNILTYSVVVTNLGTGTANSVVVRDAIPDADLTFNASTSDPSCSQGGDNAIYCGAGNLTSGQSKTILISFNVIPAACCNKLIHNVATVTTTSVDTNPINNTSQSVPTTIQCPENADVSVSKAGPGSVAPGGTITYTLTATNAGPATATNVVIADVIPTGLTFNAGSSDSHCVQNNASILCNNFSLNNGESRSFAVVFTVPTTFVCGTSILNTATVSTSTTDPVSGNDRSQTITTTVQCQNNVDVSVSKVGPSTIMQGNVLTYTVTATNAGPNVAQAVVARDAIPSGLTYNPGSSDASCSQGGDNAIYCSAGNLTSGQSRSFSVAFNVPTTTTCNGSISNTATVDTTSNDTNTVNDTSQTVSTVIQCAQPTFSISKTDNRTTAQPGETLTYYINVTNTSNANAANYTVTDFLPTYVSFNSASDNGSVNGSSVTWNLTNLPAGATKTLQLNATISSSTPNGTVLTNIAMVGSVSAQDQTTVGSSNVCNLSITLRDSRDPVSVGDTYQYTIEVRNLSSGQTNNVSLTQTLDSNVDVLNASDNGNNESNSAIRWNNITLDGNAVRTFTSTVRVREGREGATIRTSAFSCNAQSNQETRVNGNIVPPPPPPPPPGSHLTIDKKADRSEAQPGSMVMYTITVRNQSNVPSGTVSIEDSFSSGDMTVQDPGGGIQSNGSIRWDLGTVSGNVTRILTYRVRLSSGLRHGQIVSNTARITGTSISDSTEIRIIKDLPQTGMLSNFMKTPTDREQFLRPVSPKPRSFAGGESSLPGIAWMFLTVAGISTGGLVGKKAFLLSI